MPGPALASNQMTRSASSTSKTGPWSSSPRLLCVIACLVCAPAYADVAPAAGARKAEPARRNARPRVARSGLEKRVRMLSKGLDLDARQQDELRKILRSQAEQIRRVRGDPAIPGADRMDAMRAILDRTGDRIRAMLKDEQRLRYQAAKPAPGTDTAQRPDVEHWMQLTRPKSTAVPDAGGSR